MRNFILLFLLTLTLHSFGQYPFEKYPALKYREYINWKEIEKDSKEKKEFTLTVPKFFDKKDSLTIQLTSFTKNWDSSYITLFRNGKQMQRFFEPFGFDINVFAPVRLADINGDNRQDCKLLIPYMGNGIAALNTRVIYLFQNSDKTFTKVSFLDMIDGKHAGDNRSERDFNRDGNYEIITMSLTGYDSHSYWVYNLYNFKNNTLVNVNNRYDYPILIQFLYRKNFEITKNLSRQKMKDFAEPQPEELDKR